MLKSKSARDPAAPPITTSLVFITKSEGKSEKEVSALFMKVKESKLFIIGVNLLNNQPIAIKFEPRKSDAPQLRDEYRTYKIMAQTGKFWRESDSQLVCRQSITLARKVFIIFSALIYLVRRSKICLNCVIASFL